MNTARPIIEEFPLRRVEDLTTAKSNQTPQKLLQLLGWDDLPSVLIDQIKEDLDQYEEQIQNGYCSCDAETLARRKQITFWINAYRDGICSLADAIEMVKN